MANIGPIVDSACCIIIATNLGRQWKSLGRILSLDEGRLGNIELDYSNLQERAYQVLIAWKEAVSCRATVKLLAEHLKELGRTDLAHKILQMPKEQSTTITSPTVPRMNENGRCSLSRSDCIVEPNICNKVATSIGTKWISLGRIMGLEDGNLINIDLLCNDLREKGYQVVLAWKEKESRMATVDLLAQYLIEVGRRDLAHEIVKMAKERTFVDSSPINHHTNDIGISSESDVINEICHEVANRIGLKWKVIGRMLGLEDCIINNIAASNNDLIEQAYQMMQAWKEKETHRATVRILVHQLKEVGRTDIAHDIIKIAEQGSIASSPIRSHTNDTGSCSANIVDVEICRFVSTRIGVKWRSLGRTLGLEDWRIKNIAASFRDLIEQVYQMMLAWKEKESFRATVNLLAYHLEEVGRADMAHEILKRTENSKSNACATH